VEIKRVPIKSLKGATYNPSVRIHGKSLPQLIKSIAKIGLQQPILVTKDMKVIDGHRRLEAVKQLEWEEVPVLVSVSDATPEEIYAEINANGLKLTGNQNLHVFLKKPAAVTERARRIFERYHERFGMPILKQLASKGMSINVLRTADRLGHYLDIEDDKKIKEIAKWLILYRNSRMVQALIDTQQPTRPILNAIANGKPLRTSIVAGY
jgi:hypothetical protein